MGPKPRKTQGKGVAQPVKPAKRAATGWASKKVTELKDELRSRKLKVGGNKADLVARLEEDDARKDTAEGEKEPESLESSAEDVVTKPKKATAQKKKEEAVATEEQPVVDESRNERTDKAKKPKPTKTPPKKTPKNGFKPNKTDPPSAAPAQDKTVTGRIEKSQKTTKTEKARAKKYISELATIMQDLKQELGGGAKYRDTVFKKAYEDLGVAVDLLSAIEEAEDVEVKKGRGGTPEAEEDESVEASEESNAPDGEAGDGDYVSEDE
ncbi:hypothetical protein KC318_g6518 [Hortaea werneckii]|nr:hypothetical protein KC334_g6406 [Hortaea werneckii]KAI7008936.1 hypothetical protein KC355_g6745 [Hortaea werneckii]KAI7666429.1 hypothetical protein KC318_g6518 [Hortaea werneckii]